MSPHFDKEKMAIFRVLNAILHLLFFTGVCIVLSITIEKEPKGMNVRVLVPLKNLNLAFNFYLS